MTTRTTTLALALLAILLSGPATGGEFPDDWYYLDNGKRFADHIAFEGQDAPALTVGEWVGGDFKTEDMEGQILIIDFWATWCGPCIAAMPHNTKLSEKYAEQGVKLIGVCLSGDAAQMPKILEDNGVKYPNAYVQGDQVEKDWPIQFYPTYAVVDRQGVVRAIGLNPNSVEDVVETLLEEDAAASGRARIRPAWREGDAEKRARLKELEGKADTPPALSVENWINSDPMLLSDLKGKVVVLDFWATWCGPCIRAVPHHNEMMQKYGPKGLVIIGVCATYGGEALADIVKEHGIQFPVAVDIDNKTNAAYGPDGFPDYYIIDRAGNLRIADCANGSVEDAVKALLAEKVEGEEGGEEEAAGPEAADTASEVPAVEAAE